MYRYVIGMSDKRSEIRNQLKYSGEQVALHLIKLAIYPDAQERNHWKQEVYAFLHKVPKFKKTNKWPEQEFIFEALSVYDDVVDNLVLEVYDDEESLTPSEVPTKKLEDMLVTYHAWAAHELSKNGILRRQEVYDKIDELL